MNSKSSKHVRMFDGTEWATYKRGGKKHQAAEARFAEFSAAQEARKERNKAFAVVLREHDVTPKGGAWKAVTEWADEGGHGESHLRFSLEAAPEFVELLQAKNTEEGIKRPSEIAAAQAAREAEKEAAKAEVVAEEAKPAKKGKKAAKKAAKAAASERARKGWVTRRANEEARRKAEAKAAKKAAKKGKGKKASVLDTTTEEALISAEINVDEIAAIVAAAVESALAALNA